MLEYKRRVRKGLLIGGFFAVAAIAFCAPGFLAALDGRADRTMLWLPGMFVAVIFVFLILPQLLSLRTLKKATETAPGRITGEVDVSSGDRSAWADIVEYDAEGRHIRLKTIVFGKDSGGAGVTVHYVPGHPKRAWAEIVPSAEGPDGRRT